MPIILPISDLKNYSEVLNQCDNGSPVFLTKNGRGKYVVQSIVDYEKQVSAIRMLAELSKGVDTLYKDGGLSIDEAFESLDDCEFARLAELNEDYKLLSLARERLASNDVSNARSEADVMQDIGITEADIDVAEDGL